MADTPVITQDNQPFFGIQRVYLRGASLELPAGARVFLQQNPVNMDLNVEVKNELLDNGIVEVVLRATLTAKVGDAVQFLLEAEQAGIFELRNIPEDQVGAILEINCPHILTPYLRSTVSDVLSRATLPGFLMPEINWPAMFAQKQAANAPSMAPAPTSLQ